MNIKEMNCGLKTLQDKYDIAGDVEICPTSASSIGSAACLKFADGSEAVLLPWRIERRFIELKNIIDNGTIESVSTLRLTSLSSQKSIEQLLYSELDTAMFLGESTISTAFAVVSDDKKTAHLIVKLADGKSVCLECSAGLPKGTEDIDKHEIISCRGSACDKVVDTQVPQASIYLYDENGEQRYTDTDIELYGLEVEEINLVRAALYLLKNRQQIEVWNNLDLQLKAIIAETLAKSVNNEVAFFEENK